MKSGYYDDDGTLIDMDSIEVPQLCKKCRQKNLVGEEIDCNLNRFDQQEEIKDDKQFICEAFETI